MGQLYKVDFQQDPEKKILPIRLQNRMQILNNI